MISVFVYQNYLSSQRIFVLLQKKKIVVMWSVICDCVAILQTKYKYFGKATCGPQQQQESGDDMFVRFLYSVLVYVIKGNRFKILI